MLTRVTFTGADESVAPQDLIALSSAYPWCEFGILCSDRRSGLPRYPGLRWLYHLRACAQAARRPIPLALHVCGHYARQLLQGKCALPDGFPGSVLEDYQRLQLNVDTQALWDAWPRPITLLNRLTLQRQLIVQVRDVTDLSDLVVLLDDIAHPALLYDASRGRGCLPEVWPSPVPPVQGSPWLPQGYAGGLGPDNLAKQLSRILDAAGDCPIWIDMESGVRTGERFDLAKVEECLRIADPYLSRRP